MCCTPHKTLQLGYASSSLSPGAGYFQMELVGVSGTDANKHELAKCLTSVQVNLDDACLLSLDSISAGGVFIPALWASDANYKQLQECPAKSADAAQVTANTGADISAKVANALLGAMNKFVYGGVAAKDFTFDTITVADGFVTVAQTSPALSFVYAIKTVRWGWLGVELAAQLCYLRDRLRLLRPAAT